MSNLTEQEYTEELEKIIIFLCDVYSKYQDSIACQVNDKGTVDDNYFDVFMSLPTIQGTGNRIYIDRIGKLRTQHLNREAPKISFKEIYERLNKMRRDT